MLLLMIKDFFYFFSNHHAVVISNGWCIYKRRPVTFIKKLLCPIIHLVRNFHLLE